MFPNENQESKSRNLPLGIFQGLIACLYWGMVFVIPNFLSSFGDLDIVLTRYTIFGIFSLIACIIKNPSLIKKTSLSLWGKSILWTLLINPLYYFGVTLGIRYVGSAITVVIAGLAPIAVLYYSNTKQKELSYPLLFAISSIIIIGVILTHISALELPTAASPLYSILGIGMVIFSTSLWVIYVICNQSLLDKHPELNPRSWSYLIGISALIVCLPLIVVLDFLEVTHITRTLITYTPISERLLFFLLCGAMGIFSSAKALTAWNKASVNLSPALLGAILIFEPIFGLVLTYLYSRSLPSIKEGLGIFLMLGGSLLCLVLFGRKIGKSSKGHQVSPSLE
ncbi:Inner membrane protein ytfF,Predicted permease, DMT superfamily,EamA-like transporter family [Chlamydia serpentis]|uniref:Inner membrane protein ytfF,Predicted permease, DMT superfamily,EamA-like transporter family n=1 Tax=Chlamydia serpentis TaxID=1967782 RepID=A0A2R8FA35_9CHLA|nr:DMT family transporter [Chlamydia serpentis]SPN73290.1 Inner membrane protein ytfF,Predicted permease, DMT superfamily,EamA-like transporter family [Chlamydia serpentis]